MNQTIIQKIKTVFPNLEVFSEATDTDPFESEAETPFVFLHEGAEERQPCSGLVLVTKSFQIDVFTSDRKSGKTISDALIQLFEAENNMLVEPGEVDVDEDGFSHSFDIKIY